MRNVFTLIMLLAIGCFSCNKEQFLAEKPRTSLLVPTTLSDFQRLLDNTELNISGTLGDISADDYYLLNEASWNAVFSGTERNAHIWKANIYEGETNISDWNGPFQQILYANIVLQGLEKLPLDAANELEFNRIKGWAHFIRGHALYNLAQCFAPPFNKSTAEVDLGLPIRLEADVTQKVPRSSVAKTYSQILADLQAAEQLLPNRQPGLDRNRPYKIAAKAMLARVYLNMGNYGQALLQAEQSLGIYSRLIDFATLSATATSPIIQNNEETIFYCLPSNVGSGIIGTNRRVPNTIVDSVLYSTYHDNDLRKTILFTKSLVHGKPVFKGSYTGNISTFSGLATDELYLIRAECEIRIGSVDKGLKVLDELLMKRWKSGYSPLVVTDRETALKLVLLERRKELPFRGLRWSDLRRLNVEGLDIHLERKVGNAVFSLLPNSPKYVLPIPPDEMAMGNL
ncbi:MAG: RagB/SusD family nutrient uptake outer membrane protein, partial [Pedobacter sp.]